MPKTVSKEYEQDITFWKEAVKKLTKDYKMNCKDYCEDCIECRAKKTVEFIFNHIQLL